MERKGGYSEIPSGDKQALVPGDGDEDEDPIASPAETPCCSPDKPYYKPCAFLMTLMRTLCTGGSMLSAQMLIGRIPSSELNIIRTLAPSLVYIVYYMLKTEAPSIGWRFVSFFSNFV